MIFVVADIDIDAAVDSVVVVVVMIVDINKCAELR